MADQTLCYIARCRGCQRIIGVSVMDRQCPETLEYAAQDCRDWKKRGHVVTTITIGEARTAKWGHADRCSRYRPRQAKLVR